MKEILLLKHNKRKDGNPFYGNSKVSNIYYKDISSNN
jgi:hypothetical protein